MSAHLSNPSTAFPRLSQGHEIPARPQPDLAPPQLSAHSAPSAFSPDLANSAAAFASSKFRDPSFEAHPTSDIPHPTSPLPAFSDWLEHEFQDPQREHLLQRARGRANPSDLTIERDHEREWSYKDRGTPPPRANLPLFDPPPEETEIILREIADPSTTYTDIASRHSTTFEALCVWLARPDIAERFRTMRSAAARRAHFVVADNLANIAQILVNTLRSSSDAHEHSGYLPKTTRGFIAHLRSREDIRKSANLLLRIARFDFASETPSRREGAGGGRHLPPNLSAAPFEEPDFIPHPNHPERARTDATGTVLPEHPETLEMRSAFEAPSVRDGTFLQSGESPSPIARRVEGTSQVEPSNPSSAPPVPHCSGIQHPPSRIPHQSSATDETQPALAAISPRLSEDST